MTSEQIITLLQAIRKTASIGKMYAKSEYDLIGYGDIMNNAEVLLNALFHTDIKKIDPLDESGYITPKVGVNGIIENEKGEILLELRKDDQCWGLPGGWGEVGLTAKENTQKEFLEETGFEVAVNEVLGVFSRKPSLRYPFTSYHIVYNCSMVSGKLTISHESLDIAWKNIDEITNWHCDHKEWIMACLGK